MTTMLKSLKMLTIPLVLAAAGCAGNAQTVAVAGQPAPADNAVGVRVDNSNWNDIDVYAVAHGMVQRLGTITSMNAASFTISAAVATPDLQLLVVPIGGSQNYLTNVLAVTPGQTVKLHVENSLDLTSYTID